MLKYPALFRFVLPVVGAMVLVGVLPLPYAYYTLMRWTVCVVAGLCVAYLLERGDASPDAWPLILGFIALVWNPLIPVYLSKGLWVILDVTAALILFMASAAEHMRLIAIESTESHS